MSTEYIYVITGPNIKSGWYKVGRHTGTKEHLYDRYRTYLADPIILRFIECENSADHESELKKIFDEKRFIRNGFNNKGQKTEWVIMRKSKVLKIVDKHFGLYRPWWMCCGGVHP